MKTYIPKRLREIAGHPPGVTDVTDESPVLTPSVSNVSGGGGVFPEKNGSEPEPQNLETQRLEPRDTGVSSPVIPMPSPAVTLTSTITEPVNGASFQVDDVVALDHRAVRVEEETPVRVLPPEQRV